jgi:cob(I)alamin adenosyltransferase
MALKIYTRTGDQGKTSLIGGTKVYKDNLRIEAYGDIDELNSWIGLVSSVQPDEAVKTILGIIQDRLFTIGSILACDPSREIKMELPGLQENDVLSLEQEIDRISGLLPPLSAFILPSGPAPVSYCHVARCVCRRAERACVALAQKEDPMAPLVIPYLNRLSDYLFMLARYCSKATGTEELIWKPRI